MSVDQNAFAKALRDADLATPTGLITPDGGPATRRFNIYRNNVVAGLTDALFATFPVIAKLVGAANFRILAHQFQHAHPPTSPILTLYGAVMPAFLSQFPPAQALPYLPDVAHLELAVRHAYHAADAQGFDPTALQAIPPEDLAQAHFTLAPAVQTRASDWPIASIWQRNMDPSCPIPETRPEDALITRPGFDPIVTALPPGSSAFVTALQANKPLGTAMDIAQSARPEFDLNLTLGALLSGAAITDVKEGPSP